MRNKRAKALRRWAVKNPHSESPGWYGQTFVSGGWQRTYHLAKKMYNRKYLTAVLTLIAFCFPAVAVSPNSDITPGSTLQGKTEKDICAKDYAKHYTIISDEFARMVSKRYGVKFDPKTMKIDYVIPVELGGSDYRTNLYPVTLSEQKSRSKKTQALRELVCKGKMSLEAAQKAGRP